MRAIQIRAPTRSIIRLLGISNRKYPMKKTPAPNPKTAGSNFSASFKRNAAKPTLMRSRYETMYSRNMKGMSRRVIFENSAFSEIMVSSWLTNCTAICMAKQQQTVVITGASAGVGRATAHEFAKRGAKVALLARGEAGLKADAD